MLHQRVGYDYEKRDVQAKTSDVLCSGMLILDISRAMKGRRFHRNT